MAEAASSDKYAARSAEKPPRDDDALPAAARGPATPAAAMEVVAYVAGSRAALAALEAESATATAALASGPADLRRAEDLRDRVASGAAELASARARTGEKDARLASLRARRDALLGAGR